MISCVIRSLGLLLFCFLPFLLLSGNRTEERRTQPMTMEWREWNGMELPDLLEGAMTTYAVEGKIRENGDRESVLKIQWRHRSDERTCSIVVTVVDPKVGLGVPLGSFAVARRISGFMEDFDGVFGYANIEALGELPYFTHYGSITIERVSDAEIGGYADLTFRSPEGSLFNLKGGFMAKPLNGL